MKYRVIASSCRRLNKKKRTKLALCPMPDFALRSRFDLIQGEVKSGNNKRSDFLSFRQAYSIKKVTPVSKCKMNKNLDSAKIKISK